MEPSSAPWRVVDTPEAGEAAAPEPGGRPWLAVAALVIAVAVGAAALLAAGRPAPSVGLAGAAVADAAADTGPGGDGGAPAPSPRLLVVEVSGAVARPGVYRLPVGARVGDAIGAAGGYGPRVDVRAADRALNLAAPLADGQKVRVPDRDEAAGPAPGVSGASGASGAPGGGGGGASAPALVDVNTASEQELDALPGVGPATAAKIIAGRPYASVDELLQKKAVGAATLTKIRALITVGG